MRCPALGQLAAAAAGQDPDAAEHALVCVRCRIVVEDQRATAVSLQQVPRLALEPARRRTLAARLSAHVEDAPATRGGRRFAVATTVACAAALALIVATNLARRDAVPAVPTVASVPQATQPVSPTVAPRAVIEAARDVAAAPSTMLRIARRIDVVALVRAFAAARPAPARPAIEREDVWVAPAAGPAAPQRDDLAAASLAAFRTGWEALRAGRYDDAIAAFDTATAPVVAEDAAFWAAIACQRAHLVVKAAQRLHGFLTRFPASPRADTARTILDQIE